MLRLTRVAVAILSVAVLATSGPAGAVAAFPSVSVAKPSMESSSYSGHEAALAAKAQVRSKSEPSVLQKAGVSSDLPDPVAHIPGMLRANAAADLKAQAKAMGPTVGGIFLLDDIVGFVNEEHYQEFCHPYLKRICDAFPADWVKLYHNDAEVDACLDHIPDAGFNVLNWGKQTDYADVKARVGNRMCLMGNVNPLEVGVRGTPQEVRAATLDVLEKGGDRGMILSVGGGTSPGMPRANILAMQAALAEFNKAHFGCS